MSLLFCACLAAYEMRPYMHLCQMAFSGHLELAVWARRTNVLTVFFFFLMYTVLFPIVICICALVGQD